MKGTRESRAPSGDNARRSPFCNLWRLRRPLRREPGPQRRQRAFADSENHCFANHNGNSAKTVFTNMLPAAFTLRFAGAPSDDNARRNPFCSLWRLRRPLRREPGPQRRQRAPQPLLQSLEMIVLCVDEVVSG